VGLILEPPPGRDLIFLRAPDGYAQTRQKDKERCSENKQFADLFPRLYLHQFPPHVLVMDQEGKTRADEKLISMEGQ
jgi:hypothetical protein